MEERQPHPEETGLTLGAVGSTQLANHHSGQGRVGGPTEAGARGGEAGSTLVTTRRGILL